MQDLGRVHGYLVCACKGYAGVYKMNGKSLDIIEFWGILFYNLL